MKNKFDVKYILIVFLLLSVCAISWSNYFKNYRQADTVSIHGFPKEIGDWTSEEMQITETEFAILETRNAFVRHYELPSGENINLFVVYSQNNRKVSHPPEICYTGGGTMATSKKLQSIPVRMHDNSQDSELDFYNVVMEGQGMQQSLMYWFKVGDEFTASYGRQQILIALKSLMGKPSSSALIRISTVIKDSDVDSAEKLLQDFAKLIIPHLEKYLP